jgi:hypothetical protein
MSHSDQVMCVMGVSRSAGFHPVGSWLPTTSSAQSMRMGPMTMPGTPTQLGAVVVCVRAMPMTVVHAPVRA